MSGSPRWGHRVGVSLVVLELLVVVVLVLLLFLLLLSVLLFVLLDLLLVVFLLHIVTNVFHFQPAACFSFSF